jgi:hypothetical protein
MKSSTLEHLNHQLDLETKIFVLTQEVDYGDALKANQGITVTEIDRQVQTHRYEVPIYRAYHLALPHRAYFSASLSLATVSLLPISASSCDVELAVFFSLSASSALLSFLISFSSSLSPKLKGSLSASPTGLGSTADNGCHLLCFPADASFAGTRGEVRYSSRSSGEGVGLNETFRPSDERGGVGVGLKRSGLARGRVERRAWESVRCLVRHYGSRNLS